MSTDIKPTLDVPPQLLEDLEILEAGGAAHCEPWRPGTLADVDWLLETMGRFDAEAAENQALADAATQRILARMDTANQRLKKRRDYLEGLARQYAAEHRKEIIPGKAKSRELPNGTLAWRKTGGRLVLNLDGDGNTKASEAELLAWAKAQVGTPALVRVKEEPALKEIHAFCAPEAGSQVIVPPGMHWEDEDPYGKLEVKPAGSALAKVTK